MYRKIALLCALFVQSMHLSAHEMTPTYPVLKPSFMAGIYTTEMQMFNTREEVEYYEIDVLDSEFYTIPFATKHKVMNVGYLSHVKFDVYIRDQDIDRAVYICTTSRLKKDAGKNSMITTKICSKFAQR